jgi:acetyltransferase-like isoleucine patch superfamily enzyme
VQRSTWRKAAAVVRAQWHLRSATEVARTVRLRGHPVIKNRGTMIVRDRVRLVSTVATLELATEPGGVLDIGEGTFINYGCSLAASSRVEIGPECQIGTYCIVMDNDFHRLEPERRLERPESKPIVLGANVWLAARVIVTAGVTIGEGSVVGAGSVVTQDVPPRTLAAGVPARVIREL